MSSSQTAQPTPSPVYSTPHGTSPVTPQSVATSIPAIAPVSAPSTTLSIGFFSSNKPAPKFGGSENNEIWMGGRPLDDWSATSFRTPQLITWFRDFSSISNYETGFNRRTKEGFKRLYRPNDRTTTFRSFTKTVVSHMHTYGLDTSFYMNNPLDPQRAQVSLFTHHGLFTLTDVQTHINESLTVQPNAAAPRFDSYMIQAMTESGTWLLNAIDTNLKDDIKTTLGDAPTFGPIVWMHIVSHCQAASHSRVDSLKTQFKELKLTSYRGENVNDYCTQVTILLEELERHQALPTDHLATILSALKSASMLEFRIFFITKETSIQDFIHQSRGK